MTLNGIKAIATNGTRPVIVQQLANIETTIPHDTSAPKRRSPSPLAPGPAAIHNRSEPYIKTGAESLESQSHIVFRLGAEATWMAPVSSRQKEPEAR